MPSYTVLTDDDARGLLASFQLGSIPDLGTLRSLRGVEEGYSNSVFAVETTTGCYILKVFEQPIDGFALASAEQKHLIQKRCGELGMRVAEVLGPLVNFKGKKAQLMRRVDGRNLNSLDPALAWTLGKRTAEFQRDLQAVNYLCPARRMNPAELLLGELSESLDRLKFSTSLSEASYLYSLGGLALSFLLTRRELETKGVPKGMTHADINRGNVLFDPRGVDVSAFLDFDSIGYGFLLRDLVKLIYEFGVRIGDKGGLYVDDEIVGNLIAGYSSVRRLSPEELGSIPVVLDMTSRWQFSGHLKLRLVGRIGEDLLAIGKKHNTLKRSRKIFKKVLKSV